MKLLGIGDIVRFWSNLLLMLLTGSVVDIQKDSIKIKYLKPGPEEFDEIIKDTQIMDVFDGIFKPYPFWDSKWETGDYLETVELEEK